MELNPNNQKNLWVGELEPSMDENYLKISCQSYSMKIIYLNYLSFYRYTSKKRQNY